MSKTTYLANKLLDHQLGGPAYIRPSTVYVGLATAPGVECTGNGYTRTAVTNSSTYWPAASGGSKSNAVLIQFVRATYGSSGWGTAVRFQIWDAATGGNRLREGALSNPGYILVQGGDAPYIPAGGIIITEA